MEVGIVGSTGYGGVELNRILSNHPGIEKCILYSSSLDGDDYTEQYPHLIDLTNESVRSIQFDEMKQLDVVFLAVPAGISKNLTPKLLGGKAKIIDLSGDLRLQGPEEYEQWYKAEAADVSILGEAVYGLTECNREAIKGADLIANPGCFPTATLLALAPVMQGHLIRPGSVIVDAKTGLSGAGRKPSLSSHYSETQENLRIYKVHEHQHTPEIEQQLNCWAHEPAPITFTTHLIPMTRGIMTTIYADLLEERTTEEIHEEYLRYYHESPFVRLRPIGQYPSTKEVWGSNFCDIGMKVDQRTGKLTIVSVIDNLMKGAAGQAVQNMNIMFGLEETTGLQYYPIYP
ncbi:N-acetyl-gamma-glutamyl-phosphate reductase [Rossellomorea aquimaris]|uniref:N-acetyl-gamma-glutamyl-phosphate reductase n=1 Tax=Rossellomorea aquimaris TaxID=189382 RepID=UPI001CD4A9BA|nr:N-acetyl-gamma-glutamyl-phosphate reductase [Rossellomorea aquimaris]MCA1056151.1 N-acetyl-gamma-glutamyl-phosphate reductase [Rossellomorea aquimaris]